MKRRTLVLLAAAALAGCDGPHTVTDPGLEPELDARLREVVGRYGAIPIGPLEVRDPALVALGQSLVFDRILSGNRDISCATCHHPRTHGADDLPLAIGTGGTGQGAARTLGAGREFVPRNTPSLLNQALRSFYLFWDGRLSGHGAGPFEAPSGVPLPAEVRDILAAQAMLPVLDRREMRGRSGDSDVLGQPNELAEIPDTEPAAIWDAIMRRLLAIPEYRDMFREAFPGVSIEALEFHHAAEAIAAFIADGFTRTDSPFDRYLAGDDAALAPDAKRGALLFFGGQEPAAGAEASDPLPTAFPCSSCHGGPLLGGQTFANVGVPQVGPGVGAGAPLDLGRAAVIQEPFGDGYRFAFRAPPLRNVELTSPYMHSGAYATLEAVIHHYEDVDEALRTYDRTHLPASLRDRVHDADETVSEILASLDFRVREPLRLSDEEVEQLAAFLRSLTDPAARDLSHLVPDRVPSGLPVD